MEAFLVDGLRTPIGRFGGSLLPLRATEFGSTVAAALLERTGVPASAVGLVVAGQRLERRGQGEEQLEVQDVGHLGPVERQDGYVLASFHEEHWVAHASSSYSRPIGRLAYQ